MFAEDEQGKFFTYDGYKRALERAMSLEERLVMEMFNEMNKHNQSGKVLYGTYAAGYTKSQSVRDFSYIT